MKMKLTGEKVTRRLHQCHHNSSNVSEETQDDDVEVEDYIQEEGVSFVESLPMLDRTKKCSFLDEIFKSKIKNKSR